MKRWGAGSEAASESVVSVKDRRRKENTGGQGPRKERKGDVECRVGGRLSERRRRPPLRGKSRQQQKREASAWPGAAQSREEEPVGGTCGGSKNSLQARGGGGGRSWQVEMVSPPRVRPLRLPAPPLGTAPSCHDPEPQCPERLQAFQALKSWREEVSLSVLAFSASCAPCGYPRML